MIVTKENYDETLTEIDKLFDAESDTKEYDRLLMLFDAVHSYEETCYPWNKIMGTVLEEWRETL